jgi:molecular chaperone GrpE
MSAATGPEGEGTLKSERNSHSLEAEMADSDEIEILEVVGLDEDSPAAGPRDDSAGEESSEITLDFDDRGTGVKDGASRPEGTARGPGHAATDGDQLTRLRADFENYKKRVDREREATERHAAAGLVSRLLPVLDNFERALSAEVPSEDGRAFRDGVALIFRQLLDELRKEGLIAVDSLGQPFDPNLHEAVATDKVAGLPDNTVVEELRRGYLLHERLLRAAQVKVTLSKEPDQPSGDNDRDS